MEESGKLSAKKCQKIERCTKWGYWFNSRSKDHKNVVLLNQRSCWCLLILVLLYFDKASLIFPHLDESVKSLVLPTTFVIISKTITTERLRSGQSCEVSPKYGSDIEATTWRFSGDVSKKLNRENLNFIFSKQTWKANNWLILKLTDWMEQTQI